MTDKPERPWFSWWTKPRATIQQIVDFDPSYMAVPLVLVGGVFNALNRASMRSLGDQLDLTTIIIIALIIGPVAGLISWMIFGALIKWTGGWIGGRGDEDAIKAAIAWANIPVIFIGVLWFAEIPLFGHELFTTHTPRLDSSLPLALSLIAFSLIEVVIGIWAIVLYLRALGQVQGFSVWKALLNSLLAGAVILIPIAAITFIFLNLSST